MNKRQVVNSWISTGTFQDFIQQIFSLAEAKQSAYVCFANVHMVMESYQDKAFNQILNEADIATPDGKPVSVYMRLFEGIKQERAAGMDVLPALLAEANQKGAAVYFYGSTEDVLAKIQQKIAEEYPAVRLAGTYSPPFRTLSPEEDEEIVQMINESQPDLVFVALGCPKQEKWMAAHKGRVQAVMLGVGQAFLTFTGMEKRLPKWARDYSLEWAYRLWLEPKRLWKRYLVYNSWFLWLVFARLLRKMVGLDKKLSPPAPTHLNPLKSE
ncbi:MAG: WecB/TagA/CpsF family glycosyltransferase [Microscillaceae bacterium]|nr:WecB/TagA/CpsF family glycosyltransferase [Microscillaceae bacterium]